MLLSLAEYPDRTRVQEGIRTVSADIVRGSVPGLTQVSLVLERRD